MACRLRELRVLGASLISSLGRGFSLQTVSAKKRALAYPAFYEFNSLKALALILSAELTGPN